MGDLASKTDRKQQTIGYTYDQLNRLTTKTYPDSTTVNYTYDNDSRLTQVTDATGTYAFTFDNMGRLTGTSTQYSFLSSRNFTTSYSYDAASNRVGFADPEGGSTTYAYDSLNQLQTLTPPAAFTTGLPPSATGSFGFAYDALGRRMQMTRPNTVNTSYSYDNLSRLLSVLHQVGGTTIDGASYTLDAAGNRTAKTDQYANVTTNYGYDQIYQLLSATQNSTTIESYTYDAVGNRLSAPNSSGWSYNASNELTSTPSGSYTYDPNGNTLTDAAGRTYTWDYENRLTQVVVPGTGAVAFKYDPFGRRIYKSSSSGTSIYVYDGKNLVEESDAIGAAVARYTQSLNIDEPLIMLRARTSSFYQADGLGSVTSLNNSSGSITDTYAFDSFGKLIAASGTTVNPFRYTARESDSETGLYYYRARYFDPSAGRFLREDSTRFSADINFYAYAGGNPISLVDPLGLDWIEYTGQWLTLYGGQIGNKVNPLASCRATSGYPGHQSSTLQDNDLGPVPEGTYRINLSLDPTRAPKSVSLGGGQLGLAPGFGVQWISGEYDAPEWGNWRARLERVSVKSKRAGNFYIHDSSKGYTHGCIETCSDLYQRFVDYHKQGVGYLPVQVRYTSGSTNGGTKQ